MTDTSARGLSPSDAPSSSPFVFSLSSFSTIVPQETV